MNKLIAIFGALVLFLSVSSDIQRKRIRQGDFDIECYVSIKKLERFNKKKEYYWFKSSEIHNSYARAGGLVLHSEYKKFFRSKQLAEHGYFDYGLKDGKWTNWYENGIIKSITNWSKGYKSGDYYYYDQLGDIETSGYYKNSIKSKMWINHKTADTTHYKNDSTYSYKPKSKVSRFITKVFKKRDSLEVLQNKSERLNKRKQDSIKRVLKKQQRKDAKTRDSIKRASKKI